MKKLSIQCISDTHERPPELLEPCDILIHAGDGTLGGGWDAIKDLNVWFARQPATHKVFIPGNHDLLFESQPGFARSLLNIPKVLIHESIEIEGLKIFGSPWTPLFHNWAFNYPGDRARTIWNDIPDDTDIVVTHGPPAGILDLTFLGQSVGCPYLRKKIEQVKPRLHVFGHIHECGGVSSSNGDTVFLNAACLDRAYNPKIAPSLWFYTEVAEAEDEQDQTLP